MIPLPDVLRRIGGLEEAELVAWIERRWVRPERAAEGYLFRDVDLARVQLIVEIRRECAVDDEALELVLSLLDQIYRLRRQLKALSGAIVSQPTEVQERILAVLSEREPG